MKTLTKLILCTLTVLLSINTFAADKTAEEEVSEILDSNGMQAVQLDEEQKQLVVDALSDLNSLGENLREVQLSKTDGQALRIALEKIDSKLRSDILDNYGDDLNISERRDLVTTGVALKKPSPFASAIGRKETAFGAAGFGGIILPFVYKFLCDNKHKGTDNIVRWAVSAESATWIAKSFSIDFLILDDTLNKVIGGTQIGIGAVAAARNFGKLKKKLSSKSSDESKMSCTTGLGVIVAGQGIVRVLDLY